MTYALFPDVVDNEGMPAFDETLCSELVRKVGLRLGVGATLVDEEARLLLGGGMQLRSLALWGLYEPEDQIFMVGAGLADLGWLANYVGWFD